MLTHTLTVKVQAAMENREGGRESQETVFDLDFGVKAKGSAAVQTRCLPVCGAHARPDSQTGYKNWLQVTKVKR